MDVFLVDPAAAGDDRLVDEIAALVNAVYAVAERGLWREGTTRTTPAAVAAFVRAGEIAVATRDGSILGSVRVRDVAADTSEFGLLVSAPDERGSGVGRALLDFVEERGRERGLRAIRLELLVPREWSHPSKEFLRGWYRRRGYRLVRTGRLDDDYPHLAALLATACDLEIHEKRLRA